MPEPGPAPSWLCDLIRPSTGLPSPETSTPSVALDVDDAERVRLDAYAATVMGLELNRLKLMADGAKPGGHGYSGEGWNEGTFQVACVAIEVANSPWSSYTMEQAYADVFKHAPTDEGFTADDVLERWESARRKVGDNARAYPSARAGTASAVASWASDPDVRVDRILLGGGLAQAEVPRVGASTKAGAAEQVIHHFERLYTTGRSSSGDPYALARTGPQLPTMLGERGGTVRDNLTREIYEQTAHVPGQKAMDDAFRVILAKARADSEAVDLHLRCAMVDSTIVVDLGQPGNARCAVLTADGWDVQANPPTRVLFRRTPATRPLPNPVRGGSLDPLRALLGYGQDSTAWSLTRGWLVAAPFADIPRPLLLHVGPAGGGKSSNGKFMASVLDPRAELGSSFGKNLGDDQVKALGRYLVGYDNLTSFSDAVSDHICRLVTGDEIDKRRLYSDIEQIILSYRRTGIMTAVSLPPLRPDALERVIPIAVERITEGARRSESRMAADFTTAHAEILGGLLDAVCSSLRRLPAVQAEDIPRPRMADYFDVLRAYDPAVAEVYRTSTATVMIDAAEADPFVATVSAWLRDVRGVWSGSPAEAHRAASHYRAEAWSSGWWPSSASTFSSALARVSEPLRAVGIDVENRRSNGRRVLIFSPASRLAAAPAA